MTLDEAIKICEEDAEKIGGNPQSDRHAERCRQLAEWLTELRDRQWVSVDERLPEIIYNNSSEDVLIHLRNGEQYVAVYVGEDKDFGIEAYWATSDMHRDFDCDKVTHWQPLPDYPESTKG